LVERGRGEILLERIERSWPSWRGRAVEPVIREFLLRLLPSERWPDTEAVGGWCNRQNSPEIDLVGADRELTARRIHFLGSIKWLETQRFGHREYDALVRDMLAVPGADETTALVAVSRCGVAADLPLAAHCGPEDLTPRVAGMTLPRSRDVASAHRPPGHRRVCRRGAAAPGPATSEPAQRHYARRASRKLFGHEPHPVDLTGSVSDWVGVGLWGEPLDARHGNRLTPLQTAITHAPHQYPSSYDRNSLRGLAAEPCEDYLFIGVVVDARGHGVGDAGHPILANVTDS
jgi:hypothetical protein